MAMAPWHVWAADPRPTTTYDGSMQDGSPSIPSPDVTLRQLECFVAVAETGTITGAAARIHSSGSAVSEAVTSLERAIGVPLMIRRRSQGVTLTSTGQSIVALAREVLSRSTELEALARGQDAAAAPVRIGAATTLGPTLLARLISKFSQTHPDAEISYVVEGQDRLAARLAEGDLDAALVFDLDFPIEFERVRLLRARTVAVLPAGHRLATRHAVQLHELEDEPFILHDVAPTRQHVLDTLRDAGVEPRHVHATANYDLCRSLVGEGLGWSMLLGRRYSPATWGGREVVNVPLLPAPAPIDVVVASRRETHPPRVRDLIDAARETGREVMGTG